MALLDLPTDVLLLVADEIESEHDISSFTKTCRHLYSLLSDFLHRNNIRYFNSSALFWGARHNRLDTIDRMLHLGADVNSTEDDQTVLELSACEGRTAVVKFVLGRGASDGFTEGHPRTPLCAAAAEGHDDVVKILLDHDESKQQQDIPAVTSQPRRRQDQLLNQLFPTRGLNTQGKGVRYSIPLFMAIAGSHDATGDILIKNKNIDLNYRDSFQRTPLLWALSHGRDRIVSSLLSHGADGNLEDPSTRQSPLLTAVSQGNERALKLLLRYASVDPNWRDGQQRSPLFEALRPRRNLPLLRPLVGRSDLDVNRRGSEGLTPLCFAVRSGDIEVVELLLGHPGIDVHGTCAAGRTALSYAANSRRVQLVDLLLARGADPSHPDLDGRVAASYAAEAGQTEEFLRLFRPQQVQVNARDHGGWTALFWASHHGHFEMVQLLLDLGADPNAQDTEGETPLICTVKRARCASWFGIGQTIRLLLERGADPNVRDCSGVSALCWAREDESGQVLREVLDVSCIARDNQEQNPGSQVTSNGVVA